MGGIILAWLVPTAFATFAIAFLILRLHGAGSYWWVGAFGLVGAGFAVTILPVGQSYVLKSVVEDTLFLLGVLSLTFGVASRFDRRPNRYVMAVLLFGGIYGSFHGIALLDSVVHEVVTVQSACVLMMLELARVISNRLRHAADRILFGLVIAFCLSLLAQNALLWFGDHDLTAFTWRDSLWAYIFQFTGSVTGILFAVTLLVSLGLDMIERMRSFSRTDPLSGIFNRRGFDETMSLTEEQGAYGNAIVLLDIDNFKRINDRFGHAAGDLVITHMGALLSDEVGRQGIVSRLGGEEFAIILHQRAAGQAAQIAEKLRVALAARQWPEPLQEETITASFGVSLVQAGETMVAAQRRADENLYRAKREGRDRVVSTPPAPRVQNAQDQVPGSSTRPRGAPGEAAAGNA